MITALFKAFTLIGSEWVMWLLMILSIISVAFIIDRLRVLRSQESVGAKLWSDKVDGLMKANSVDAKALEGAGSQYPCLA